MWWEETIELIDDEEVLRFNETILKHMWEDYKPKVSFKKFLIIVISTMIDDIYAEDYFAYANRYEDTREWAKRLYPD